MRSLFLPTNPTPSPPPAAASFLSTLARDLRLSVVVSAVAAVMIVLTNGHPELLYEQLVYSLCIGVPGFTLVDLARLRWWPVPGRRPRRWPTLPASTLAPP